MVDSIWIDDVRYEVAENKWQEKVASYSGFKEVSIFGEKDSMFLWFSKEGYAIIDYELEDPKREDITYCYDNGNGIIEDATEHFGKDEREVKSCLVCRDYDKVKEIMFYFIEQEEMHPGYTWTLEEDIADLVKNETDPYGEFEYEETVPFLGSVTINGVEYKSVDEWEKVIMTHKHLENIECWAENSIDTLNVSLNDAGEYFIYKLLPDGYEYLDFGTGNHEKVEFLQDSHIERRYVSKDKNLLLKIIKDYMDSEEFPKNYQWVYRKSDESEQLIKINGKSFSISINDTYYNDEAAWKNRILTDPTVEMIEMNEYEDDFSCALKIERVKDLGFMLSYSEDVKDEVEGFIFKHSYYEGNHQDRGKVKLPCDRELEKRHICSDKNELMEIISYFLENAKRHPDYSWVDLLHMKYIIPEEYLQDDEEDEEDEEDLVGTDNSVTNDRAAQEDPYADAFANEFEKKKPVENHMDIQDNKSNTTKVIVGVLIAIITLVTIYLMNR